MSIKSKIIKQVLYAFILVLTLSLVSALTIQEYVNSLSFDYSSGQLNITNQVDYMIDNNSNSINDTLLINLTTNAATTGTYLFSINLIDKNGIITSIANKTINSVNDKPSISFKSSLLSQNKYNYTIRIFNSSSNLIYRKDRIETKIYTKYERGINIVAISDQNINNDYLRINLTLNATENSTSNITVVLKYNDSSISSTEERQLAVGIQAVSIDFDNETIKSTHYYGNFTVDTVVIGNKVIDTNKNTSVYSYETFAKTSYTKGYASDEVDTNNNNLSDYFEINFTVNIKTAGAYNILADLYDLYGNYIASINETQTLSTGEQTWETKVNGSDIYLTRTDGPYILSFAKLLKDGATKDIVYNPYTTKIAYYTDFERPLLPDLTVKLNVSFSSLSNETKLTINISNIGQAPAFNVFLDVFDNKTYANNKSKSFLDINEYTIYQFNLTNTTNSTIYIAIVDFNNYVDESNESNNVAIYIPLQPPTPTGDTFNLSNAGNSIAIFDSAGNLFLKNTLTQSSNPQDTSDDEFLLRDNSNTVVAKINSTGYMEIKGILQQNQGSLTDPPGDDFLIKEDDGTVVAYINESGFMFLKGSLYENYG